MDEPAVTLDEPRTEVTEPLPPNDANNLGRVLSGVALHWMDICRAIAVMRFSDHWCATVSIDYVDFIDPIDLGEVAAMKAYVFNIDRTSVDMKVDVHAENPKIDERQKTITSFPTFVVLDDDRKPTPVPRLACKTDEEEELRIEAIAARVNRLKSVIGRME